MFYRHAEVDDFALYGDTYGTLLVDATTRLPLTLWEGRDADQLSRWLREHPGVEVVCRDGSLSYRQGIAGGAPDAVQVSDCFHLWQGLSRRVQDIASAHRGCLPAALPPAGKSDPAPAEETVGNPAEDSRAARHARRLFEAVQALTRTGRSHSFVARELGLDHRTVGKCARARTWQEVMRRPPRKPSTLDPYLDYLQQRWDEGQHSAKILHEELQGKGYLGHYQRVKMAVAPLRRGLPLDEPCERPPSPREAARWITSHPHRRSLHINDRLPRLLDHCPELSGLTIWSDGSPSCLITATRHLFRAGSTTSQTAAWPLSSASPEPFAKTGMPSPRESPPLTTQASTKAASPTSSCRNA
ncbi:transposase [Streptomyces sp. NPDC059095]|uniref:transposase n=1 Tax=unclassified Streptomyces TaxID=2593676 RepID=UPI0035E132EE